MISTYVDLALGLVITFLLLSLLVSGINEGVVRVLSIRSKFLWAYLRDTMDGTDGQGKSFLPAGIKDVFAVLPFGKDPRPAHQDLPAPVESAMPAQETKADDAMTNLLYERVREIDHAKGSRTAISNLPPERFASAVMEMAATQEGGVEAFLDRLKAMNSPLYGHLKGTWDAAQRDLERFKAGVTTWFDSEMQRLSLLYKRYVKWAVAALGIVVVLLFSVDGLEFAKTLLRDNAFRASVSAVAEAGPDAYSELKTQCQSQSPVPCITDTLSSPALVKVLGHAIVSVDLPAEGDPAIHWNGGEWWSRITTLSHWPGYLLTYVALLFGASFWWDLLRRISGLKSRS
ncbi:MAG: hypothetical protein HOY71_02110 [Nonomuraea sp.]|nr:hypothetical protein [Nonomuraea sp.]